MGTRGALLTPAILVACLPGWTAAQERWQVAEAWTVSLGDGAGAGHEMLWVRDATVLPDGRIVVVSGGTHDLRVFSPEGAHIETIGGQGQGPGEYQAPTSIRLLSSGELLVYDRVSQRLTRLGNDWEVVDTRRIAFDIGAATPVPGRFRPMADGSVPIARAAISVQEAVMRSEGLHEDELVLSLQVGESLREIVRRPRGPTFGVKSGNVGLSPPVPFAEHVLYAAGADALVVGTSHGTEFELFDAGGRHTRSVRAAGTPRPATERDWDAYAEDFRARRSQGATIRGVTVDPSDNVEAFLRRAPRGELLPLFDTVALDDLGRVWLREYAPGSTTSVWQALPPGAPEPARVEIPSAWQVLEFGDGYLLALERDAWDVEIVRRYEVAR